MSFLVDTNVFSEERRRSPNPHVRGWFEATPARELFTSVVVLGELRRWVELTRRRDHIAGDVLAGWLEGLARFLGSRVHPVTHPIADHWGRLGVPVPDADGLIAATALVHDLTVVTRNTADFERTGVRTLNPFESSTTP